MQGWEGSHKLLADLAPQHCKGKLDHWCIVTYVHVVSDGKSLYYASNGCIISFQISFWGTVFAVFYSTTAQLHNPRALQILVSSLLKM